MLRYLLDTTICIDVINRRPHALLNTFNRYAGQMVISAITFSELLNGVEKSAAPVQDLAAVEDFCSRLDILPYDPRASLHYGQIRALLEGKGIPIGVNDLHIAAHARCQVSPW